MKLKQLIHFMLRIRNLFRVTTVRLGVTSSITPFEVYEEEDEDHAILPRYGYTMGEKLGEGSFSYVIRGHSEAHGRDVAIKIINKRQATKLYIEKFLPREIELTKVISHKNIVEFLHVAQTKSFIYVIMGLAANGNLLETIIKNSYIDEKRACRWFHHLVDGIAFCHGIGIAHRDLKCENLLLDEHNVLKISDFSLARGNLPRYIINNEENLHRGKALSSTFCGSYAYSCPEILMRRPYEPHLSDVWSIGVVLYAMVSGRLPFDDSNLHTLLREVRRPVRFRQDPILSKDLKALICKILSPSRNRIYIPRIRIDAWYINTFEDKIEDKYDLNESSVNTGSSLVSTLRKTSEPFMSDRFAEPAIEGKVTKIQ